MTNPQHFTDPYRNYCELVNVDKDEEIQRKKKELIEKNFKVKSKLEMKIEKNRSELKQFRKDDMFLIWKKVIISAHMHLKNNNIEYTSVRIIFKLFNILLFLVPYKDVRQVEAYGRRRLPSPISSYQRR